MRDLLMRGLIIAVFSLCAVCMAAAGWAVYWHGGEMADLIVTTLKVALIKLPL